MFRVYFTSRSDKELAELPQKSNAPPKSGALSFLKVLKYNYQTFAFS